MSRDEPLNIYHHSRSYLMVKDYKTETPYITIQKIEK